jgi:hypothetical protein
VREGLASLLRGGSDRLEALLDGLRAAAQAMPFERVELRRGRARYRDERPRSAGASEVSGFRATIAREPGGVVQAELTFDAPAGGGAGANRIAVRVAPLAGDVALQARLHGLELAPWGALLPVALRAHGDSALRAPALDLVYDGAARTLRVEGEVAVTHLDLRAPRLARHLISDLSLRGKGRLSVDLGAATLQLQQGELAIGELQTLVEASLVRATTAPAFQLSAKVPTIGCQAVVDSLVGPLAPLLAGSRCQGDLSLRLQLDLDTAKLEALRLEFEPLLRGVTMTSMGEAIDFDVLRGPFEHHARQRDGSLFTFVTGPGTARWVPLAAIAEHMVQVVTTTEDGSFFWHKGFSLNQIRDAMVTNLQKGRFVRGASTISQQVVKNLFFVEREKTIARKLQEAVVTWQLEQRFSKQEILELYFNIIEFGPLIYGLQAAAAHYFNRPPAELTLLQSIWLGSIIPNPRGFYHHFSKGGVSEAWQKTLCWIADVMLKREKITAEQRQRLGSCAVVFGGGPDGSEPPPELGLGHEGALGEDVPPGALLDDAPPSRPLPPPTPGEGLLGPARPDRAGAPARPGRTPAPSVSPEDQP